MSQAQAVLGGDVYPQSAGDQEARRERDRVITQEGHVKHDGALHVDETDLPGGKRMVTSSARGQVLAQFTVPVPDKKAAEATDAVTVGEALQAAAQTSAGDRPVGLADASAVQAAEMRATGLAGNLPGGVAAAAQRAAEANMKAAAPGSERGKARLKDVVGGAAAALPANKVATREDAEKVAAAAGRNKGATKGSGARSGVVEAMEAAADMNKGRMM